MGGAILTTIDVNLQKDMVQTLSGISIGNECYTFFYDETGNCRKFYLKDGGVNSVEGLTHNFLLGGVAYQGTEHNVDFESLYRSMHFVEGQKELKFKHLYNKSIDFLSFMNSQRASDFLSWLENSGLYVHYSTLNNLYYSLVDIVDSLFELYPYLFGNMEFIMALKSALYDFTVRHREEILNLLFRHTYPDVTNCSLFCKELCELIYQYNNEEEYYPGFFLETLRQMLKQAGKENKLVFVQDNTSFQLIEEYYLFYLERCEIFSKSIHFFDEEFTVQKRFESIQLVENGKEVNNYHFVKSHENRYIQVSDMFIGLLGKLFQFLDENTLQQMVRYRIAISEIQAENFKKVYQLIERSDRHNKLLLKNANSVKNINERIIKLKLLAGEEGNYEL